MIYLVEDDANIRELVTYTLNSTGLAAVGFETPREFWEAVGRELPELLLLDIMLPQQDGLSILKQLRADPATARLPVILLTAKDAEMDKVKGFEAGADDYIAKPFRMMELVVRVKALLRRTAPAAPVAADAYRVGDLYVDPARHEVRVGDRPVTLTLKEFNLLCVLLKNRNIVLTRDRLLDEVWNYSFDGEARTVDVHIRTLRRKLGTAGHLIRTVRGMGYKIGNET